MRYTHRIAISLGPEDIKVLTAAFDDALRASGLTDRADPIAYIIAKRIIDLARLGEFQSVFGNMCSNSSR